MRGRADEQRLGAAVAVLWWDRQDHQTPRVIWQQADTVLAYGGDAALRDLQAQLKEKGLPWERAKCFDGACVLAPFVPGDAVEDLGDIGIRLTINGEVRQDGNSSQMLNAILPLLQHIAGHFSLQPGDVVLTGTPAGVGPLKQGDQLVLELVGLSRFESRVI